jgi:Domain of unknown function (DUF3387)
MNPHQVDAAPSALGSPLSRDIRAARARGEEAGLTDEEITFYNALTENESARQ